jgi:hypothetical protein
MAHDLVHSKLLQTSKPGLQHCRLQKRLPAMCKTGTEDPNGTICVLEDPVPELPFTLLCWPVVHLAPISWAGLRLVLIIPLCMACALRYFGGKMDDICVIVAYVGKAGDTD